MDDAQPIRLPVDPEHNALRFAILLCFIGVGVVAFLLSNALLASTDFGGLLSVGVALGAAILITRVVEIRLRKLWPSGRALELSPTRIRLLLREEAQRELDAAQHVNVLAWRFPINRRTRVPKGWYVVSLGLVQEETTIAVYTFMSPDDYQVLPNPDMFTVLVPSKKQDADVRLAGQQRRLREAEIWRWHEGAELTKEDFTVVLDYLKTNFPAWMVQGA